MLISFIKTNILQFLGYILLAFLAKLILPWKGIDVPFWPAAGWATAITVIYGYKTLPAVMIANVISASCNPSLNCTFDPSVMVIGLSAAVQAGIVAYIIKKTDALNKRFTSPNDAIAFTAVIGPLGSWLSALAFYGFLIHKNADIHEANTTALVWWLGDSMGSLVFFPLTIIFLPLNNPIWKQKSKYLAAPLICITLIPFLSSPLSNHFLNGLILSDIDKNKLLNIRLLLSMNEHFFVLVAVGFSLISTGLKLAQDKLANDSAAASIAAAAVIHEISQPLMRLRVIFEEIERKLRQISNHCLVNCGVDSHIIMANGELDNISKLSRSIKDLTVSGIRDTITANLEHALKACTKEIATQLHELDQDFKIDYPYNNCHISAGQTQLQSILRNIINNASIAAGEQGVIRVFIKKLNENCIIEVHDSGPGFKDEMILAAPQQVASAWGGMGIGLAISCRAVEASSGQIKLSRSSELGGARVDIIMPLTPPPQKPQNRREVDE